MTDDVSVEEAADPDCILRRWVVAVLGLSVLLVGVALLALPGPALVVIPMGFGILAIEFEWARRCLRKLEGQYAAMRGDG